MIGLIFGETDFPKYIYRKIKDKNSYRVSVGQFGKILSILKKNNCKKILFAGKVKKPKFSKLKLDLKGVYYISKIIKKSKIGDAAILREIINIFNKKDGVLVKFPKKKQDRRLDLPAIGLDTLKQCKSAGLKGIVLKHKNNIFLDKTKSIEFANKNKMFILVK